MIARTANRKNLILEQATILFSRDGFDSVTTRQIAEACGMSEAALYRHFPSKEGIYQAVLDSLLERIHCPDLFERLSKEDNLETILREIAGFLLTFLRENDDLYRLLLFAVLRGDEKAREIYLRLRGDFMMFLTRQLERFEEKGILYDIRPNITARCFIGMVMDCASGFNLWQGVDKIKVNPQESLANNIPIYARGLIKDKSSEDK